LLDNFRIQSNKHSHLLYVSKLLKSDRSDWESIVMPWQSLMPANSHSNSWSSCAIAFLQPLDIVNRGSA